MNGKKIKAGHDDLTLDVYDSYGSDLIGEAEFERLLENVRTGTGGHDPKRP